METSNLKNMVVLKNLPSNIIDEAIIVLKSSKKIKKLEKIEQNNKIPDREEKKEKDYILKEAEMLVNNYVSKIEEKKENKAKTKNINNKYKKLKKYAIIATLICVIQTILLLV